VTVKQPFETVVADHGTTVLRVCRAVLGPVDADDAWSETFLAAMKAYPQLPDDANVEAWLVTIAHRKAIDVTRARSRAAIPTDTLPETSDQGPQERDDDLADDLAGLPYTEVAAILGGTATAARRSAADGIATLRRTYAGVTATSREGESS
jgi:DNA-directed RNA polymerase specialized sigma24 family protein